MFNVAFVRWAPNKMNIWRHNTWFTTWLAHAHYTTFDLIPRVLCSLPGNEVPVHSPSCHVQSQASYPRKGMSLNSWLTQGHFSFVKMHQFLKLYFYTLLRIRKKIFDKWVRSASISPLFRNNDFSTDHFQSIKSVIVIRYQTLDKG